MYPTKDTSFIIKLMNKFLDTLDIHTNHISFHTPGHNGEIVISPKDDITELSYSDNLLYSSGIIRDLEADIANLYGADNALIFTNGATSAVFTAILALRDKGDFLIVNNAHVSVFNALRLIGATSYVTSEMQLDRAITLTRAKVIIVTYPDYYGDFVDIEHIATLAKENLATIILDASHYSHYIFSNKSEVRLSKYASLVIHSLHKTLPVLTGGAVLLSTKDYYMTCSVSRQMIHSTSPSYLTIRSIAQMPSKLKTVDFLKIKKTIEKFQADILKYGYIATFKKDYLRLVISTDYDSECLTSELVKHDIFPEMNINNLVVFLVTPYNYHYLSKLEEVLASLDKSNWRRYIPSDDYAMETTTVQKLTFYTSYTAVCLEESINRISYREVGLYPPGTPLLFSGQLITAEKINILKNNVNNAFGLVNNAILVVN